MSDSMLTLKVNEYPRTEYLTPASAQATWSMNIQLSAV